MALPEEPPGEFEVAGPKRVGGLVDARVLGDDVARDRIVPYLCELGVAESRAAEPRPRTPPAEPRTACPRAAARSRSRRRGRRARAAAAPARRRANGSRSATRRRPRRTATSASPWSRTELRSHMARP